MTKKEKSQYAPEILCQILSPFKKSDEVEKKLQLLLKDEELLDLVIELANRYFLIPTFYTQLCNYQLEQRLDEELKAFFIEMTHFMKQRSQSLVVLTKEIISISNQQGITPLLIKGSATLFSEIYPENGVRFMSDLDVLFKEEDALVIFTKLQTLGFEVPSQYLQNEIPAYYRNNSFNSADLPASQHLLPLYKQGAPCGIEIHYRPLSTFYQKYLNNKIAFENALDVTFTTKENLIALKMSPENELIYCFVHTERAHSYHQYHIFDMRQMDFFVRLAHANKEKLNWNNIHQHIEKTGEIEIFQLYLQSINRLFDTDFPVYTKKSNTKQFNKHYAKGIASCFPIYNSHWKFKLLISETSASFSKKNLSYKYNIDTLIALLLARFRHIVATIIKFSHPVKLYKRLKFSVRMFFS